MQPGLRRTWTHVSTAPAAFILWCHGILSTWCCTGARRAVFAWLDMPGHAVLRCSMWRTTHDAVLRGDAGAVGLCRRHQQTPCQMRAPYRAHVHTLTLASACCRVGAGYVFVFVPPAHWCVVSPGRGLTCRICLQGAGAGRPAADCCSFIGCRLRVMSLVRRSQGLRRGRGRQCLLAAAQGGGAAAAEQAAQVSSSCVMASEVESFRNASLSSFL